MFRFFRSVAEIAGIVFLRFPLLVRLWALLVVAINAAGVFFIQTIYAQAALVAVTVGVVVMALIYSKLGFVRLLGIGHFLWIPMLPWLYLQLPAIDSGSWLFTWAVAILVINTACFVVDTVDVSRYLAGERSPHYVWNEEPTSPE